MNSKRIAGSPFLIPSILLAITILSQLVYGMRTFDDAFITFRYARNISNGAGFVYNPGQPVLGTSTPLFSLFLAGAGSLLGTELIPRLSFITSLLFEAVNCLLLFKISFRLLGNRMVAGLVSAAYILQPVRLDVVVGGMESPLYLTLLLLMYHDFILREMRWTSALWAGLAFLVRPDSLLASLPLFLAWFIKDRTGFLTGCLVFSLITLPWLCFSYFYFGQLLPNTILAKSIAYHNPPGHALWFLATFYSSGTLNIYLPVAWISAAFVAAVSGMAFGSRKLVQANSLAAAWVLFPVLYCCLMSIQNPAMWFPWYYLPLIPVGILSLAAAVWSPWQNRHTHHWLAAAALLLVIVAIPQAIAHFSPSWDPHRQREAAFWEACEFIQPHIDPGTSVLAPDIGVLGWCLDQATILDPIGLVSPQALPYQEALESNQWISPDLVADFQPEYIIAFDFYLDHALAASNVIENDYLLVWQKNLVIQSEHRRLVILHRTTYPG